MRDASRNLGKTPTRILNSDQQAVKFAIQMERSCFKQKIFRFPAQFSQVAADILAQKYFRKAGVAAVLKRVEETSIPSWLWRSEPDTKALAKIPEDQRYSGEMSANRYLTA